jgi:hypothetical protein
MKCLGRIVVLLLSSFALVAAGCGGDTSTTGDTVEPAGSDTATAPAGAISDADVAAGLARMVTVAAETAAKTATGADAGKAAAADLETAWAPIEDVVKANDPDTYVAIEDAMALLQSGDVTKAADGAAQIGTAITAYVAEHPG